MLHFKIQNLMDSIWKKDEFPGHSDFSDTNASLIQFSCAKVNEYRILYIYWLTNVVPRAVASKPSHCATGASKFCDVFCCILKFCLHHGDTKSTSHYCHLEFQNSKIIQCGIHWTKVIVILTTNSCTDKAVWAQIWQIIQSMFGVSSNALIWTKWNSQYVCNFKDSGASVFKKKFLHSIHTFHLFFSLLDNLSIHHLQQRSHHSQT